MRESGKWVMCPRCGAGQSVFVPDDDTVCGCPECDADDWTDGEEATIRYYAMSAKYDHAYDRMCRNGGEDE